MELHQNIKFMGIMALILNLELILLLLTLK